LLADDFEGYLSPFCFETELLVIPLELSFLRQFSVIQLVKEAPFPFFVKVLTESNSMGLLFFLEMNVPNSITMLVSYLHLSLNQFIIGNLQLD
jgi:hypothetical protein